MVESMFVLSNLFTESLTKVSVTMVVSTLALSEESTDLEQPLPPHEARKAMIAKTNNFFILINLINN